MNLVNDLLMPVLTDDECKLFNKSYERMHAKFGKQILEDLGSGSIFENIIKINEYCTSKLMTKIDLTKPDMLGDDTVKKPLVKRS